MVKHPTCLLLLSTNRILSQPRRSLLFHHHHQRDVFDASVTPNLTPPLFFSACEIFRVGTYLLSAYQQPVFLPQLSCLQLQDLLLHQNIFSLATCFPGYIKPLLSHLRCLFDLCSPRHVFRSPRGVFQLSPMHLVLTLRSKWGFSMHVFLAASNIYAVSKVIYMCFAIHLFFHDYKILFFC